MAPKIILHIGPEKCGSTTIQHAISAPDGALAGAVTGHVLDPYATVALDRPDPEPHVCAAFGTLIEGAFAAHPDRPLVLSHEMIFKSAHMARNLARIARSHAEDVQAVAYLRRQSDFVVSAFGQWHFRTPERIREAAETLRRAGIDPGLFWGIERHLIAGLIGGWDIARQPSGHLYLDWAQSVSRCAAALETQGARLVLGVLPRSDADPPLIADFAAHAGVQARPDTSPRNPAFPAALIEAVVNAIEAGHPMPGPHEANNFFAQSGVALMGAAHPPGFVERLKAHVDAQYFDSNTRLCERYALPVAYFEPDAHPGNDAIRAEIEAEAQRRAQIPVSDHTRQAAARGDLAALAWHWFQRASARPKGGTDE